MPDYKQMYLTLFHATEKAIGLLSQLPPPCSLPELRREVKRLLIEGQQKAEDIYIDTCEDEE